MADFGLTDAVTPSGGRNTNPSPSPSSIILATVTEAISASFSSTIHAPPAIPSNATNITDNITDGMAVNGTGGGEEEGSRGHDFSMTISMTVIYILITITGVLGNVATCIVIARNRIMHTATNYYLFSMAVSDLLLLAFGMPDEMFALWWGSPYLFGPEFCFIRGFTAEISTNASILTIAAFTVERYIGICHPLRSHTMSQLGRVIRSIAVIWIVATACAVPIAIQYGIVIHEVNGKRDPSTASCLIKERINWVFEISSLLFFVVPMLLITVLYVCIAIQLKRSARMARTVPSIGSPNSSSTNDGSRNKAVIKMLVAVVIAFFVCFAPHQAQRLMAIHADPSSEVAVKLYTIIHNISGISYYISTCVNPILYHIMSNRFRQALQVTLESCCGGRSGAGGGGFHESEAMFMDNYKNGTSGFLQYSQSMKHRRCLSVKHQPATLAAQKLRHTNSLTSRQVNSIHNPGSCQSYRRDFSRPLLRHQSTTSSAGGIQGDETTAKTNGTSHTWV